jgi:hypothetical protein
MKDFELFILEQGVPGGKYPKSRCIQILANRRETRKSNCRFIIQANQDQIVGNRYFSNFKEFETGKGNAGCAFVEVLVGTPKEDPEKYQVMK